VARGRSLSRWLPVICAAAAVAIRLPFLLKGEAFFNSDEGLEGLIARHIGSAPIFFWGQGYKGVPEAYLAAATFAIFGVGVIQLKCVTLAIWAAAVGVSTRLGQRWYGDAAGFVTGALLALGPPSLIYWSLSASAEIAWLTLIFSGVLLAYQRSVDAPAQPVSPIVMMGCGAALWIHPIALAFVAGLALVAAGRSRWWRDRGWTGLRDLALGRGLTGAARAAVVTLHALVASVLLTFLWTYAGGRLNAGFVTAAHPQKAFRVLAIAMGLTVAAHALIGLVVPRRRAMAAFGWLALGLLPVGVYVVRGGVPGSMIFVHSLADAPGLVKVFVTEALPMTLGMKEPSGGPVAPWWWLAPFAVLIAAHMASIARAWRRGGGAGGVRPSDVMAAVTAGCLFVMLFPGGAFNDILSYRYLMPYFGLLMLSAASGARFVAARSRVASSLIVAMSLAAFFGANLHWFDALRLDDSDREIVRCLEGKGIRAATADYWIAYRMTFLADERVIVNPDLNARYLPYADAVRNAARRAWIQYTDNRAVGRVHLVGPTLCTAASLEALDVDRIGR